jgi:hypothetical protein
MPENHVATAEDFRALAKSKEAEAEIIKLPTSGLRILVKRPTPSWFLFRGRMPQGLAARSAANQSNPQISASEIVELSEWIVALLEKTVIKPKICRNPKMDEIGPDEIPDEDLRFIIRYAQGEVAAEGSDLESFRGNGKSPALSSNG